VSAYRSPSTRDIPGLKVCQAKKWFDELQVALTEAFDDKCDRILAEDFNTDPTDPA
jgi:hypothetical protein